MNPILFSGRPAEARTAPENAIYDRLDELHVSYTRIDHDSVDTMEDCRKIEGLLGGKICKNLFLSNRQQTEFYLLMMPGEKNFKTKYLSAQIGCSRLSFAGPEQMCTLLRTIPGSVSALELLFDSDRKVRLLIDEELLSETQIGVHPGRSTSTILLSKEDLMLYLQSTGHKPVIISLPSAEE